MTEDELLYTAANLVGFTEWLIDQVERKLEVETDARLINTENQRYKRALGFYADEENYTRSLHDIEIGYPPEIHNDGGYIARQALEGESE